MLGQYINPCSQKNIPVIQYDAIEWYLLVIAINLHNAVRRSREVGKIAPRKMRETIPYQKFIILSLKRQVSCHMH